MSAVSLRYFVLDVFLSFLTEVHLSLKAFQMDPNAPRPEGNVITPAIGDQLHVSQKVSHHTSDSYCTSYSGYTEH